MKTLLLIALSIMSINCSNNNESHLKYIPQTAINYKLVVNNFTDSIKEYKEAFTAIHDYFASNYVEFFSADISIDSSYDDSSIVLKNRKHLINLKLLCCRTYDIPGMHEIAYLKPDTSNKNIRITLTDDSQRFEYNNFCNKFQIISEDQQKFDKVKLYVTSIEAGPKCIKITSNVLIYKSTNEQKFYGTMVLSYDNDFNSFISDQELKCAAMNEPIKHIFIPFSVKLKLKTVPYSFS